MTSKHYGGLGMTSNLFLDFKEQMNMMVHCNLKHYLLHAFVMYPNKMNADTQLPGTHVYTNIKVWLRVF